MKMGLAVGKLWKRVEQRAFSDWCFEPDTESAPGTSGTLNCCSREAFVESHEASGLHA